MNDKMAWRIAWLWFSTAATILICNRLILHNWNPGVLVYVLPACGTSYFIGHHDGLKEASSKK
jgi:hypothetical protein